jgi:hypothetical protein
LGQQSQEEQATLLVWKKKQSAMEERRKRDKQAVFLVGKTGFVERNTNRATKLSQAEEEVRLHKSWKLWDGLLWLVGCGTSEDFRAQKLILIIYI